MKNRNRFFLALALLATLVPQWAAWAASASSLEFEEDFALPIVYVNIVLDAGTAQDPEDKLGLAHVASHMLLRGTQKHPKLEFFELLNRLGGEFNVDVRNEGTVFRAAVLSENIEPFLALVDEALSRPKFTADELQKVKKETVGTILEQKGNDKQLVQYHFSRFLYGSHPFGNPVLGTQKGVNSIAHKDVIDFYARNFGGGTLRLIGTGAVKKEVIERWFNALTDRLSALHPEAKPAEDAAKPRFAEGRRALLIDKPKTTQAQVLLGGEGLRPEMPGFYAILLANHSFGGPSFQARMMQEIRVKRGWTYGAYNTFRFGRERKHFAMYLFPKTEDTPQAIELALKLFEDFAQKGITPEEYRFARDSMVNNAPFNYDTSKKRLENSTTEYLTRFPRGYFKDFAKNIAKVEYADVAPALRDFFRPDNLALTVVGDSQKLKGRISQIQGFSKPVIKSYLED